MDVRFGHTGIQAQFVALGQTMDLRQNQQAVIELMERSHLDQTFQIIQRRVVWHPLVIDPHPLAISRTVAHFLFDLAIRPLLATAQHDQAQRDFHRHRRTSHFRVLVMLSQVSTHQTKQFPILQQCIQLLQDRITHSRCRPVFRTLISVYNHRRPPKVRLVLENSNLIPSAA